MSQLGRLLDAADALRRAVLTGPASTSTELRRAVHDGAATGTEAVDAFAQTVREHAYRVTDAQFAALREVGLSDDAIFEITVASALGAAQRQLSAGLTAVHRGSR